MHAEHFKIRPTTKTGERMNWNAWIRQVHRWLAITFTLIVALIFIVLAFAEPPMWLYYTPLPFLFLLMFSGLYMFFLPYVVRRRAKGVQS
jgi:FtsH-binding integral membrane protein